MNTHQAGEVGAGWEVGGVGDLTPGDIEGDGVVGGLGDRPLGENQKDQAGHPHGNTKPEIVDDS